MPTIEQLRAVDREYAKIVREEIKDEFYRLYLNGNTPEYPLLTSNKYNFQTVK